MNRKMRLSWKPDDRLESYRIALSPEAQAALRAGRVGLWRWEIASNALHWSDNLEEIHGLPDGTFDGTVKSFLNDIHPDDRKSVFEKIERAIKSGSTYHVSYRVNAPAGGDDIWIEGRGEVHRDGAAPAVMTGICHDITEKRRVEAQLEQRVLQQEVAATLGKLALGEMSFDSLCQEAVRLVANVLGVEFAKILELLPTGEALLLKAGVGFPAGLVGKATVETDLSTQAGFTLKSDIPVVVEDLAEETRFKGHALLHDHGVASGMSVIIPGSDRRPFGVFGVHSREHRKFTIEDVSFLESVANVIASAYQRSQVEERRRLVLREMRHRSGNLLAIIASMIARTTESSSTVEELGNKLRSRVISLSNAHALIMQGGWSTTPLRALLDAGLSAFGEQIDYQGRDMLINADVAFPLSMVVHELATNASKHGSLSTSTGRVVVKWRVDCEKEGKWLVLSWTELGTPGGGQAETRVGFGTRLIQSVVEQQLNGTIAREFTPEGLDLTLRLPLSEIGSGED